MLRIKVKRLKKDPEYTDLEFSGVTYTDDGLIEITTVGDHKIMTGDTVKLYRTEAGVMMSEEVEITITGKNTFTIPQFPNLKLYVESAYTQDIRVKPNSAGTALVMTLMEEDPHYYIYDKEWITISEYVHDDYDDEDRHIVKRCVGDYVLYNDEFLYQADSINPTTNKYVFGDETDFINIKDADVFFEYSGETYHINGVIPVNGTTKDNRYKIYFFYDDNDQDLLNSIELYYNTINFYYKDIRFFEYPDDDSIDFVEHNGVLYTRAEKLDSFYRISLPLGETFATDTHKEESFGTNYVEQQEEESINPIIDYEKQIFNPMFSSKNLENVIHLKKYLESGNTFDEDLQKVEKITFNLHFRERADTYTESGDIDQEWITDDEKGWFNYGISGLNGLTSLSGYENDGDLLGSLGFTDEDVLNQKNALKKTFIRLSFYDTRSRANQALQFYSTMFIDTGELLSKYLKIKNFDGDLTDCVNESFTGDTYSSISENRLTCSFSCQSKYNMTACSEGFYLYLFPSLITGSTPVPLYMKVEFYHAKYGYKIPMIMPVDENCEPKNLRDFPTCYMVNGEVREGYNVMGDVYIKVYIKYDFYRNQFVWFFPNKNDSNEVVLNLFEPRLNGWS